MTWRCTQFVFTNELNDFFTADLSGVGSGLSLSRHRGPNHESILSFIGELAPFLEISGLSCSLSTQNMLTLVNLHAKDISSQEETSCHGFEPDLVTEQTALTPLPPYLGLRYNGNFCRSLPLE